VILCPSDSLALPRRRGIREHGNSYVVNLGDILFGSSPARSPMGSGWVECASNDADRRKKSAVRARHVTDGLSKTIIMSERAHGPGDTGSTKVKTGFAPASITNQTAPQMCLQTAVGGQYTTTFTSGDTQWRWGRREPGHMGFHTILPPNSPSCITGCSANGCDSSDEMMMSASSHHSGGVNVAFADGAVRFVSELIDAGDPTQTPPSGSGCYTDRRFYKGQSLWGVWGALGTMRGGETVSPVDGL
jgi:prepilin-type processing-associated H-X9-DG protein